MSSKDAGSKALNTSSDWAIAVQSVSKCYRVYPHPVDRLKEALFTRGLALGRRLGLYRATAPLNSGLGPNAKDEQALTHFYQEFWSLRGVSLELKRGEVLGVVGVNGAGKSSLLQLICGVLQATSGAVQVRGRIAALLELGAGFNPDFTGRENIELNATLLGLSPQEIKDKMQSIIEFSGIENFIDQPVKTYSSGMYVRLAFSIATSVEPDILVIDEALSVGDGAFARKSFDRIMALKDKGVTILFCSHNIYQVESLCERAIWLDHGQVKASGPAHQVCLKYNQFLDQLAQQAADQSAAHQNTSLQNIPMTQASEAEINARAKAQKMFGGSTQGTQAAQATQAAGGEALADANLNTSRPDPAAVDPAKISDLNAGVFEPDTAQPGIANGVARLTAVNLWVDGALQAKGAKPQLQSLQSDFQVEVVFTASLTLKCPSVALVVTDHTGRNITSCSNFYDQVSLTRDESGVGKARVVFPKFQLLRGQYALNVFLMCERAIHIYDHSQVCEFEVEQEGREIGLVSLNRTWVNESFLLNPTNG